jgi:RNA polymerase sigma-70 factor (ECF subfamily)
MTKRNIEQRLSSISTVWSLVYCAHRGPTAAATSARQQLLERYGGAVCRYLRKVLADPDAVEEVFQEFALQVVRGNLRGANHERGRFRNFVKGILFHLVADYRKEQRERPRSLPPTVAELQEADSDHQFVESWCDELLARAWAALGNVSCETTQPLYAVLRFRADHPDMRSPQLAKELTLQLGKPFTPAGVRQILHRAREKFAALLLDEVIQTLENPNMEELGEELIELGLLDYCRPALERHRAIA